METLCTLVTFCEVYPQSPVDSPHKCLVKLVLALRFLILASTNSWTNSRVIMIWDAMTFMLCNYNDMIMLPLWHGYGLQMRFLFFFLFSFFFFFFFFFGGGGRQRKHTCFDEPYYGGTRQTAFESFSSSMKTFIIRCEFNWGLFFYIIDIK